MKMSICAEAQRHKELHLLEMHDGIESSPGIVKAHSIIRDWKIEEKWRDPQQREERPNRNQHDGIRRTKRGEA